ncbi:MAG: FAD:protein transferase [Solirubrobacterales bacterium]|jgi:thiamine biosynthesis lipoprotein|nr:FAD:protein transferase [Solirubrobacterales bacterium]
MAQDDYSRVISAPDTSSFLEDDRRFKLFGSHVRVLIGEPVRPGLPSPEAMGIQIEFFLRLLHRKLSRFDQGSELCALNAEAGNACSVSPTLAVAIGAGLWAARRSDGLVDPTLVSELEDAGYATSRADLAPAGIGEALAVAPERNPASPRAGSRWRDISVDAVAGIVSRPPGIRLDTGGSGKGLAADLASDRLAGYSTFVVDAGGDLRIGGDRPLERQVRIDHPLEQAPAHEFMLDRGAVATSGIKTRLWQTETGYAHHLLDPSTGDPAWTGVIQASSLGSTALEAETLAKMAFLSGPERAREILDSHGGLIVLDDGTVELCGSLAETPSDQHEVVMAA